MLSNKHECIRRPCITLNMLDCLYEVQHAARYVIKSQLLGLYGMSMSKEPFNENNAEITADLFLSRYGNECTMYMMMIYFSSYLMDYKGSYTPFDVQDILKQFRDKFLIQWNASVDAYNNPYKEQERKSTSPAGTEALMIWLNNALNKGEDVRMGGLYRLGIVTETMIAEAQSRIITF